MFLQVVVSLTLTGIEDASYVLTVNGIRDTDGHALMGANTTPFIGMALGGTCARRF